MAREKTTLPDNVEASENTEIVTEEKKTTKRNSKAKKEEAVKPASDEPDSEVIVEDENEEDYYIDEDMEDEEDEEDEELKAIREEIEKLNKTYEKRRYEMLTGKQKKKAYHSEKIVGAGADFKTENDYIQEEAEELMVAAQSVPPKILQGIIVSYNYTEHGIPLVHVNLLDRNNFIIKIPVSQLFMHDEKRFEDTPEGIRALEKELKSRIGSVIDFLVYNVKEAELTAYGSRLAAMELRSKAYYTSRHGKEPRIKEGTKALARVVAVTTDRVKIDVCGVETELKSEELSWTALDVLTNEFKVGDKFAVVVHDIEPVKYSIMDKTYKLFKIRASKREAEKNPAEKFFHHFEVGQKVGGVVKSRTPAGIFVKLQNKMDALCTVPGVGNFTRGDSCIIEITLKDEEKKHLFGRFV